MKFVDFTAEEYIFVTKLLEETKATTNKDLKVLNGAFLLLKIASADDHYRRYVKIAPYGERLTREQFFEDLYQITEQDLKSRDDNGFRLLLVTSKSFPLYDKLHSPTSNTQKTSSSPVVSGWLTP